MGQPSREPLLGGAPAPWTYSTRTVSNLTRLFYASLLICGNNSKMDSFVRSKYESRRWAREGPPPSDPSILESGAGGSDNQETVSASSSSLTSIVEVPVTNASSTVSTHTTRQPRHHQLLSAATVGRASAAPPTHAAAMPQAEAKAPAVQPSPQPPSNDLFTLDFHSPSPSLNASSRSEQLPKKDVKSDILSLFSTSSSSTASVPPGASIPQANSDPFALWGQQTQAQAAPVTSMVGQSGVGMWGVQSGWTPNTSQTPLSQTDVWGSFSNGNTSNAATGTHWQKAGSTNALFETSNVWGSGAANANTQANGSNNLFGGPLPSAIPTAQKKDDVFGDLWGDFK